MKKRIITGVVAMGLIVSMSVPAFAVEIVDLTQGGVVMEEIENIPSLTFSDVSSSHWAYNDIMTMVNKGVIAGTTTPVNGVGTYNPEGTVTLGQFLAIATRLVASDKIVEGNYAHWAGANYQAAIESGIIRTSDFEGTPAALNANISREDMAYILVNIAKVNGENLQTKVGIENNMKDYASISADRKTAVAVAYSNGLLAGDNYGKFNPHQVLTRAQVAAVFCRVMNYNPRPTVTVNQGTSQTPTDTGISENGYISMGQETNGMLIPAYSRQYDLQALESIRVGEDSKGVYVTFTAPTLPSEIKDGFKFSFSADVENSQGNYFADSISVTLKSGETKKVYFVSYSDGSVSKSQIATISVSARIYSNDGKSMMGHTVYSSNKNKAIENWYDGSTEYKDISGSAIFAGIGK